MMTESKNIIKAIGICSGGLDSILSAKVLQAQGIYVEWINFETPFFSSDKAQRAAAQTGIPITVRNITPIYLEMLRNPRCGYGKHMNPCMDCHTLMFNLAGEEMKSRGFHFLFSGEVLGQRPMSQTQSALRYVEKHSGYDRYILRPLSAKKLKETIPEQEGWVDRERLYDFSSRSRKPQMELAKQFGITDYPTPAGGCSLTEKVYSARLKDLFDHQKNFSEGELHLLKFGRHFRLDDMTKVIVGRTMEDNNSMMAWYDSDRDILMKVRNIAGPVLLIPNGGNSQMYPLAASICVRYSKASNNATAEVTLMNPEKEAQILKVRPISLEQIHHFMI